MEAVWCCSTRWRSHWTCSGDLLSVCLYLLCREVPKNEGEMSKFKTTVPTPSWRGKNKQEKPITELTDAQLSKAFLSAQRKYYLFFKQMCLMDELSDHMEEELKRRGLEVPDYGLKTNDPKAREFFSNEKRFS